MGVVGDKLHREVDAALSQVIGQNEGSIVSRWIVLAETVDQAGDRGVWQLSSARSTPWDTLGLLEYAVSEERANLISLRLGEGGA
jgi:hypothetical protein